MNAGLPGTGLGGIFYILGALWMPIDATYARLRGRRTVSWRVILRQWGIAAGVIVVLWLTGWALGYLIALRPVAEAAGGGIGTGAGAVSNVIHWAGVVGTVGVLALVIAFVHILRFTVRRPRGGLVTAPQNVIGRAALILLAALPPALTAQSNSAATAHADALYAAGNAEQARIAYEQVLEEDAENSRALYRLAGLVDDPKRSLALLRAYVAAEPQDAWGHWALGEALARVGDLDGAADALAEARRLEPAEQDFVAAEERLKGLRTPAAPELEAGLRVSRDSDRNTTLQTYLDADVAVGKGLRLGLSASQLQSRDDVVSATAWQGQIGLDWSAAPGSGVEARIGLAKLAASDQNDARPGNGRNPASQVAASSAATPLLRLRARWRPLRGPAAELRLQHAPVSSTPTLLATPLMLSEVRGSVDIPVAGPLYLRGLSRAARLQVDADTNTRVGWGGGALLRGGVGELGALYQRTGYAHDSDAGYSSPRQIEAAELGGYLEVSGAGPFEIALDGGVGGERVTQWNAASGAWKPAFRLWSEISWNLQPGRSLRLELEAYESQAGAVLAPTGSAWRWGSVGLSFRTALR